MPLQFQTEIKPSHVKGATAGIFWRQTVGQPVSIVCLLVLFAAAQGIIMATVRGLLWWWYAGFAVLMAATGLGALFIVGRYYQELALRNFSRFKNEPVRVSLDQDAYRYEAAWGAGAIEWSRFQSLWRLKNVWVLLQHAENGASVLLPAADLDGDARIFLKDRMAEAGATVRG
jgi:hypothetical protein